MPQVGTKEKLIRLSAFLQDKGHQWSSGVHYEYVNGDHEARVSVTRHWPEEAPTQRTTVSIIHRSKYSDEEPQRTAMLEGLMLLFAEIPQPEDIFDKEET